MLSVRGFLATRGPNTTISHPWYCCLSCSIAVAVSAVMLNTAIFSALRRCTTARRVFNPTAAAQRRCRLSTTANDENRLAAPPESGLSKDGVAGRRIDFDTQSKIEGNENQIVTVTLEPGQVLRAESGGRCLRRAGIEK